MKKNAKVLENLIYQAVTVAQYEKPSVRDHKRLLLIDDDPNLILLVKDY